MKKGKELMLLTEKSDTEQLKSQNPLRIKIEPENALSLSTLVLSALRCLSIIIAYSSIRIYI